MAHPVPSGPLQIMVSLQQQRLTVFDGGQPILSSAISSGQSGYETPTGIYSILQKNRYHESNIYSGAPMPYMQRITWSGIALHEGHLPGYPASHGCIRLPGVVANTLFALTRVGARVIVSHEPLSPRAFEHDRLFKPILPTATDAVAMAASAPMGAGYVINTAAAMPASDDRAFSTAAAADGRVAILISRQTGKIYIRRNFEPVYEGPVTIRDPDLPLGTHLFTAIGFTAERSSLTWNVVTYPTDDRNIYASASRTRLSDIERADVAAGVRRSWVTPPGAALERVELDPDLLEEIAEVARPGLSLMITDRGPGRETGKGTEFVIQTR